VVLLQPIHDAVGRLGLPLARFRKIKSILGALEVQIEDGGDAPEVNRLLLDALRAVLRHQVGSPQMHEAAAAIDAFMRAEAVYWEQVRTGTLPPLELTPALRLDDLMQEGYALLATHQRATACDRWLEAWDLVKQLARPAMRSAATFDQAYALVQPVEAWCPDLEMELGNAGLDDPAYNTHWLRYAREFLMQFPGADSDTQILFTRAEGEALWRLGRQTEADTVYAALVQRFPQKPGHTSAGRISIGCGRRVPTPMAQRPPSSSARCSSQVSTIAGPYSSVWPISTPRGGSPRSTPPSSGNWSTSETDGADRRVVRPRWR
jgi:hypothetical protein